MKKLYRSSNRILAGVCGGVAEYLDVDPTLIRVIYVALSMFTAGFQASSYLIHHNCQYSIRICNLFPFKLFGIFVIN